MHLLNLLGKLRRWHEYIPSIKRYRLYKSNLLFYLGNHQRTPKINPLSARIKSDPIVKDIEISQIIKKLHVVI